MIKSGLNVTYFVLMGMTAHITIQGRNKFATSPSIAL